MIRISCLPVGGIENPYQSLMIAGLNKNTGISARTGAKGKLLAITRTLLRDNPDVVHFDWNYRYFIRKNLILTLLNTPVFLVEILVSKLFGYTIVWTMHNLEDHQKLFPGIEKCVLRIFARACKWIRVFSNDSVARASKYLNVSKHKFKVLPEGSYIGYYPNRISRKQAQETLNIPQGALVFLYFGSIRQYKGILESIDDFTQYGAENWVLIIAGRKHDFEYSNALTGKIRDKPNIRLFDNFIEKDQVQIFFNAADIAFFPFKQIENSGSVNLAMGFGKPIVTSQLGILPQKLKHQDVLLFKKDSSEVLKIIPSITVGQLEAWGKQNYQIMRNQRWEDFGNLFTS